MISGVLKRENQAMNRLFRSLADACRRLEIRKVPSEDGERRVSIGVSRSTFPERLYEVAECLEEIDRSEAYLLTAQPDASTRMQLALDGVMAWMKVQGIDTAQPMMIAGLAMGKSAPEALPPEVRKQIAEALQSARMTQGALGQAAPMSVSRKTRVPKAGVSKAGAPKAAVPRTGEGQMRRMAP